MITETFPVGDSYHIRHFVPEGYMSSGQEIPKQRPPNPTAGELVEVMFSQV